MVLAVPPSQAIDRIIVQEAIEHGQRIRSYTVEALHGDGKWSIISSGISVGNKRIDLLEEPATTAMLRLNVTANKASPVYIKFFGAYSGKGC